MLNALRLYCMYASVSLRSQLQYRASFILQVLGTALVTGCEFFAVWALFDRFGNVAGWELADCAVFYGAINITWGLAEGLGRGFDDFGTLIKSGDFDRVLLRPRSTVLQVLGRELTLRRLGRIGQGACVLLWGWKSAGLHFSVENAGLFMFILVGGIAFFLGLLIFQATISFWTIESLEIMNVLTYGGVATAQYPLTIYPGWLRQFFIYVVPLGCVSYFPLVALLGKTDPLGTTRMWQVMSPAAGFLFLAVSLVVWRFGLRRYTSTGS